MPNPKWRFSKTRTRKRRTHDKLVAPQLSVCTACGAAIEYHHVCSACGAYKGKQAINMTKE